MATREGASPIRLLTLPGTGIIGRLQPPRTTCMDALLLRKLLAGLLGLGPPCPACGRGRRRPNWSRGLFRLWAVAAACWIAYSAFELRISKHLLGYWTITQAESDPSTPGACLALIKAERFGHGTLTPHEFDLLRQMDAGRDECRDVFLNVRAGERLKAASIGFLELGLLPPAAVLALWWAAVWVARGFRERAGT